MPKTKAKTKRKEFRVVPETKAKTTRKDHQKPQVSELSKFGEGQRWDKNIRICRQLPVLA